MAREIRLRGLRMLAARWWYFISNHLEIRWMLDVATVRCANLPWDEGLVEIMKLPEDKAPADVKRADPRGG